jgi:mono/diheme cytochrome c family protein
MRANMATGWGLLIGGVALAVLISIGLYNWDVTQRAAEASLRPQPVAPLAVASPTSQPSPVAAAATPAAQPAGDASAGAATFQTQCNTCHPSARAGIGPALYGAAFAARYPDDAALSAVVRNGRGGMPAFATTRLSDQDLENVVAYLRSLATTPEVVASAPTVAPVAAASATSPAPAAGAPTAVATAPAAAAGPTPLSQQVLTSITPGLSTFMLEAAKRMGRSWFSAQADNWDSAAFEIREARGVLQQGAARSNATRQPPLLAFNDGFMTPLVDAAQSGDRTRYESAYRGAIGGCNACHASQPYGTTGQSFAFIRVQVPTNSMWDVYAYAK